MPDDKTVVCAFANSAGGPGWSNSPVWVVLRDGDNKLSTVCLQPEEQSTLMMQLYIISENVNRMMSAEAERILQKRWRKEASRG